MEQPEFSATRARLIRERRIQARRRAVVAATLLVVTLALVPVAVLTAMSALWLVVPGGLLACVLVLGRRAVVRQQRADEELARRSRMARRAELATRMSAGRAGTRRVGRPVPVAQPRTQATAAVSAASGAVAAVASGGVEASLGWSASVEEVLDRVDANRAGRRAGDAAVASVSGDADSSADERTVDELGTSQSAPATRSDSRSRAASQPEERVVRPHRVPRSTYTTKPAAPRWEPRPLSAEIERASRAMESWEAEHSVVSAGELDEAIGDASAQRLATEQGTSALGDEAIYGVLERRRAVGE